jgi:hypothetical protein
MMDNATAAQHHEGLLRSAAQITQIISKSNVFASIWNAVRVKPSLKFLNKFVTLRKL